jgi:DNA-binding NarL/FixJ family response regulator
LLTEGAQRRVTVAVIDDHDVVHAGIEAWCATADPPIDLVGRFLHPREFLATFPDVSREVDVVLLDLQIEGGRPDFDTLRALSQAGQRTIVYSHLAADEIILSSLEFGAVTYLVKSEGRLHLIEAIHSAASGTPYTGPRMAKALANDRTSGRIKLSEREIEVLRAWFQTESKELVGKRLYIAPTTVRTHLQRARAKYAAVGRPAPTKSALLARAVEDGILSLNEL